MITRHAGTLELKQ